MQRLRLLRRRVSVRGDRSAARAQRARAARSNARSATTGRSAGLTPACAKACPTESIQFGPLDELRARARQRAPICRREASPRRTIYNPVDTSVGGIHAFSLLPVSPAEVGLPASPEVPTIYLRGAWLSAALTSALAMAGACAAFALL